MKGRTAEATAYTWQLHVDSAEPLIEQNIKDANRLNVKNIMKTWNVHFHADCALMRKDYKETEKRYAIAMKENIKVGKFSRFQI